MDGFTKSEPALSGACCAGADLYHPIGQFLVSGRIQKRKFNVPTMLGHGPPALQRHLTQVKVAAAATDRGSSQPGANSERRSGSIRALTTGLASKPSALPLSYEAGFEWRDNQIRSGNTLGGQPKVIFQKSFLAEDLMANFLGQKPDEVLAEGKHPGFQAKELAIKACQKMISCTIKLGLMAPIGARLSRTTLGQVR